MFTSIDKALVALIGAAIFLVNSFLGTEIQIDPAILGAVVTAVTPVLVYLIPNKSP